MLKIFLFKFTCLCLFVFSSHMLYATQFWHHTPPRLDWGARNDDIPHPDFSKFPKPDSDDINGWLGTVILSDLDLSGRDLRNARVHLLGGILQNCKFDNANLEGADFSETSLINCSFRGANLKYATIIPTANCDMTDVIIGGVAYYLTAEQMRSTWNFKNRDFSNTCFISCNFPNMEYDSSFNFINSDICFGSTDYSVLTDSDRETGIDLRNNMKLEGFGWMQLPRWKYGEFGWTAEHVFRTHDFRKKSLHGLTFYGLDFSNCDFSGFTLGFFESCTFQNANFEDAVKLTFGSRNHNVPEKIFGFRNSDITKEQIEQTRFWKGNNIRGIILEGMNLDGWDFSNKDLSYASLAGSSVENTNFENAIFYCTNCPTITAEQLMQTRSWKNKKITYCEFRWVSFDNQDLSGFDFSGTKFIGCSFKNTNLTGAKVHFDIGYVTLNKGLTEKQIRSLENFNENMLAQFHFLPCE